MMLLPPDLREWVPEGDIVHFIIEAAGLVPLGKFHSNEMGVGEELQVRQMEVLVALPGGSKRRPHDFRRLPATGRRVGPAWKKPWAVAMRQALASERGQ